MCISFSQRIGQKEEEEDLEENSDWNNRVLDHSNRGHQVAIDDRGRDFYSTEFN